MAARFCVKDEPNEGAKALADDVQSQTRLARVSFMMQMRGKWYNETHLCAADAVASTMDATGHKQIQACWTEIEGELISLTSPKRRAKNSRNYVMCDVHTLRFVTS